MIIDNKLISVWKHNGEIFGYPKCCIDYFCSLEDKPKNLHIFNFEHGTFENNSGFVPCLECKKLILENKTSLTKLIDYKSRYKNPEYNYLPIFKEIWKKVN